MISQSGKSVIERFVTRAKTLLTDNVTALLQQHYGIWMDGRQLAVEELPTDDTTILHTAKLLRDRLQHIQNALPANTANAERIAVGQLVAEQAFTILNRFCALRMCEERELIFESIRNGYNSGGFDVYKEVTKGIDMPLFNRYVAYIQSVFDELSVELPSIFNRFSPYGLIFPDETAMFALFDLINDEQLTASQDAQTGETLNLWQEDETIGWIYQYYNSIEERRAVRDASNKPRNSREMAIRNQFFTPEYIVRFLTDNALGRYWYEMTNGQSHIGDICQYMVCRPDEELPSVPLKEPTEIRILDPTCGSMHFGIYAYEVNPRSCTISATPRRANHSVTSFLVSSWSITFMVVRLTLAPCRWLHSVFGFVRSVLIAKWALLPKTVRSSVVPTSSLPRPCRATSVCSQPSCKASTSPCSV